MKLWGPIKKMPRGSKFRITGGARKGHSLLVPSSVGVRPMQGFIREALFNILGSRIEGGSVLDLFSGTGSIGLEALSRGASSCVFFEYHRDPHRVLIQNIKTLRVEATSKVFRVNLLYIKSFPASGFEPYDFIFLDPPFPFHDPTTRKDLNPMIHQLGHQGLLAADPLLVLQLRKKHKSPPNMGFLSLSESRNYGSVSLNIYN
jgi:16S rRNA (guanine966-N2)-methyltransferase